MSESNSSRRAFLMSSAAAAALAAGAQFAFAADADKPWTTKAATKPKSLEQKRSDALAKPLPTAATKTKFSGIRVAHIGIGGQGGHDLSMIIKSGATIAAICDVDTNTLDKRGSELPNAKK